MEFSRLSLKKGENLNGDSRLHLNEEAHHEEEEENEEYRIRDIMNRKRYHYIFCNFVCGMFFIIFLELSYKPFFNEYLSLLIVAFVLFRITKKNKL